MKLDELKDSWKKIGQQNQFYENKEELRKYFNKSSSSPLVNIRKNMVREVIGFSVAALVILLLTFNKVSHHPKLSILLLSVFAIMIMLCSLFYYRIYKNTKANQFTGPVKKQLKQNIQRLSQDLNNLRKLNYVLLIPSILFGIILSQKNIQSVSDLLHPSNELLYLTLIIAIVIIPVTVLIIRWWIEKNYGQYLEELQEIYDEMAELDDESAKNR